MLRTRGNCGPRSSWLLLDWNLDPQLEESRLVGAEASVDCQTYGSDKDGRERIGFGSNHS
jgi:hypothetical protein